MQSTMSEAPSSIERAFGRFSAAISHWSQFGHEKLCPEYPVLTQRASFLKLSPPSRTSANGQCRLVRCKDGWVAINLPRDEDRDMVPALLESSYAADTWTQIHSVAAERCAQSLLDQSRLLGMAVAALGEAVHAADTTSGDRGGVSSASSANARKWRHKPRVVDLSALWAGPLCGSLLAQAGCQVVKVESISRPDNSIGVGGEFSAMLNKDKISARFDFKSPHDRNELQSLLHHADIIITSARRRGLDSCGLSPESVLQLTPSLVWIAITGHGLAGPGAERVGFGDDCAVAGGLVDRGRDDSPRFVGDAVADPFTGLRAAALALKALATQNRGVLDISLAHTAAVVNAMRMKRSALV
jgi:hypothetical protein